MSKYWALLTHSGPSHELIPVPLCILGGWHRDSHKAVASIATVIAPRAVIPFENAHQFPYQRHAAQLVTVIAYCFMQGWAIEI